jgi:hypothetical protein
MAFIFSASHGKELPCPYSFFFQSLWADIYPLPPPVLFGKNFKHFLTRLFSSMEGSVTQQINDCQDENKSALADYFASVNIFSINFL